MVHIPSLGGTRIVTAGPRPGRHPGFPPHSGHTVSAAPQPGNASIIPAKTCGRQTADAFPMNNTGNGNSAARVYKYKYKRPLLCAGCSRLPPPRRKTQRARAPATKLPLRRSQ